MKDNKNQEVKYKVINELSDRIECELKENLPNIIESDIRREFEKKARNDAERNLEWSLEQTNEAFNIERKKLKQKYEEKLNQSTNEFQAQLDAEFPGKVAKIVDQKERDIKAKYKRQLEVDKKSYETKAKANYEANITKELKKLEAEKVEFTRQKAAYNNMIHQFELQKTAMSAKLRESELMLIKKQTEARTDSQNEPIENAGLIPYSMIATNKPINEPDIYVRTTKSQ